MVAEEAAKDGGWWEQAGAPAKDSNPDAELSTAKGEEEGERKREKGESEEEEGRRQGGPMAPHVSGPTFLFV